MEVVALALSGAERARRYRRRKKAAGGAPLALVGRPVGNSNARTHGARARDVDQAAAERLPALPQYLLQEQFAEAVAICRRRVEMASRIGRWVAAMPEDEALTPAKAGSSSPAEVSRQQDTAALNSLSVLGLTPQASARWGRSLEESGKPDLALMAMWQEEDNQGA